MIVFYKLEKILKERNMYWKDLCNAGISVNTPQKFSGNKNVSTDTIDKICAYLNVQPGDIMEWINEKDEKKAKLKAQIEQLQKQLDEIEQQNNN